MPLTANVDISRRVRNSSPSTTNPQALPAGLSEWAILDSNQ
jgi:hypothetical protein